MSHLAALVLGLPMFLGLVLAGAAAPAAAAATSTVKGYTPVTPVRICDTRAAAPPLVVANPCEGPSGSAGTLSAGSTKTVVVAGANGVPATALAVVLNVTATDLTADSYFTVWPTGVTPRPTVSNLNWTPGQIAQNLVTVPLGSGGAINVYNNLGSANLVIDLEGYVDATSTDLFSPLSPARICDTRAVAPGVAANQCQGAGGIAGTLTPGAHIVVTVAGMAGVPANATSAVLNVTVDGTTAVGFLTVWPDGTTRPLASNLNWAPGQTVPNRVIVPLGPGGKIDIFNSLGRADVIVDVNGYFSPTAGGNGLRPYLPTRVCDTRPVGPGVALNGCNDPNNGTVGPLLPGDEISLSLPTSDSAAVVFNVTVADTTGNSYLTLYPDPNPQAFSQPPLISDLNWTPGVVVANLVVVSTGPNHAVAVFNNLGDTDIIIDVQADYTTTPTPAASVGSIRASIKRARSNSTSVLFSRG